MEKRNLYGLDPHSYEHPLDRKALQAFKATGPLVQGAINALLNWTNVRWHLIDLQGSHFKVTDRSCPELYRLAKTVAERIDLNPMPPVYTQWGYFINAYTAGFNENAILVLYSGAVDLLTDDELTFVIGHEMGHQKSGHSLYHYMALYPTMLANAVPVVGTALTTGALTALQYWNRMSEFTADRAGLLACQDIDVALNAIVKMSGLPLRYFDNINREAFLEQARAFDEQHSGLADKAIKTISIVDESHPWTVKRAAELIRWYESGEYERTLNSVRQCPHCHEWVGADATVCPICGLPL